MCKLCNHNWIHRRWPWGLNVSSCSFMERCSHLPMALQWRRVHSAWHQIQWGLSGCLFFPSLCHAWGTQVRPLYAEEGSILQCPRMLLHSDALANQNADTDLHFLFDFDGPIGFYFFFFVIVVKWSYKQLETRLSGRKYINLSAPSPLKWSHVSLFNVCDVLI